jgi:hypothetical protein
VKHLRLLAVVALALTGQGCAMLSAVARGESATGVLSAGITDAALIAAADDRAEKECEPIKAQQLSWEEERAVGSAVSVGLVTKGGHLFLEGNGVKDPAALNKSLKDGSFVPLPENAKNELTAYVSVVGKNLARYSTRPELPWTFGVIDSEGPNAFSAPGGYVIVTTGLLRTLNNEAQLAGVLAHEIAHVTLRHALNAYRSAKYDQCKVGLGAYYYLDKNPGVDSFVKEKAQYGKMFAPGAKFDLDSADAKFITWLFDKAIDVVSAGNNREAEFEADKTALEIVGFAGYDATEFEKLLTSMGSGGGWLSNHPSNADRAGALKKVRESPDLAPFMTGTAKPDVTKPFAVIPAAKKK